MDRDGEFETVAVVDRPSLRLDRLMTNTLIESELRELSCVGALDPEQLVSNGSPRENEDEPDRYQSEVAETER